MSVRGGRYNSSDGGCPLSWFRRSSLQWERLSHSLIHTEPELLCIMLNLLEYCVLWVMAGSNVQAQWTVNMQTMVILLVPVRALPSQGWHTMGIFLLWSDDGKDNQWWDGGLLWVFVCWCSHITALQSVQPGEREVWLERVSQTSGSTQSTAEKIDTVTLNSWEEKTSDNLNTLY